jgi:Uma2 family endonuclease
MSATEYHPRMATPATRDRHYTFEDFLVLVREDEKADLLDGVIYVASPDSPEHNSLCGWLDRLMGGFADELDLGTVFISRVAFRITGKRGPEPDLAFVTKRRLGQVRKGFVDGPPDIAVEVVSLDSVERDYGAKRDTYERGGVREYWIIDPRQRKAVFLRRFRGRFREVPLDGTIFESKVLRGFRLDLRWLWAKRRPSAYRLLRELIDKECR